MKEHNIKKERWPVAQPKIQKLAWRHARAVTNGKDRGIFLRLDIVDFHIFQA